MTYFVLALSVEHTASLWSMFRRKEIFDLRATCLIRFVFVFSSSHRAAPNRRVILSLRSSVSRFALHELRLAHGFAAGHP